jgi:hypothetical protein
VIGALAAGDHPVAHIPDALLFDHRLDRPRRQSQL